MDKINNFLSHVYGSSQSLLYFYFSLGAIALFFIILILIILFSAEHRANAKAYKKKQLETKKVIDKSLSETQVFTNILKNNSDSNSKVDEYSKEEEAVSLKEEQPALTEVVPEPIKDETERVIEEKITENIETTIKDDDFYLEEPMDLKANDNIDTQDSLEDAEMPKVKHMDIDDYLFNRDKIFAQNTKENEIKSDISQENEVEEVRNITKKEDIKVEEVKETLLSNDELKNRLARLKAKKEVKKEEIPDDDLTDLMKAVGLEESEN